MEGLAVCEGGGGEVEALGPPAAGARAGAGPEVGVGVKAGAEVGDGKAKLLEVGVGAVDPEKDEAEEAEEREEVEEEAEGPARCSLDSAISFSSVALMSATRSAIRASRSLSSSS